MMTTILVSLIAMVWAAFASIGTQAYEAVAVPVTHQPTDYAARAAAYRGHADGSRNRLNS